MKKKDKHTEEVTYWESLADNIVGLFLYAILIILLLLLSLLRRPEEEVEEPEITAYYEEADDEGYGDYSTNEGDDYPDDIEEEEDEEEEDDDPNIVSSGGGGGGEEGGDEEPVEEDEDPDFEYPEEDGKAAVWVQVVDGETLRTIKKEGIEFELYNQGSELQILSTYYPVKVDYRKYETDKNGVFYLPEKLPLGTFYLHDLSTITGYDIADNQEFTLDRTYEWEDPYVVTVTVLPSMNYIRLQLRDKEDGTPLSGASFDVVAAEDLVTQDGTTRFRKGETADTIVLGSDGYGESKELYLGKYLLKQKDVPEYYGIISESLPVEVGGKSEAAEPELNELAGQKTAIRINVSDALYASTNIEGAVFEIEDGGTGSVQTAETDVKGQINLTDLRKDVTYHIRQLSTIDRYRIDPEEYSFTVDVKGLIDGEIRKDLDIGNQTVRAMFGVKDRFFSGQVSDINVALYDSGGTLIRKWNTSGIEETIEGLEPGQYRIVLNGEEEKAANITIEDVAEIQTFEFVTWTMADIGVIAAGVLLVIGMIIALILVFRHRRRKRLE